MYKFTTIDGRRQICRAPVYMLAYLISVFRRAFSGFSLVTAVLARFSNRSVQFAFYHSVAFAL